MTKEEVFSAIVIERRRQDSKWDRENIGWTSSLPVKYLVLAEEVGEVAKAVLERDKDNLKEELVQVAALCMAWLESFDKGDWR